MVGMAASLAVVVAVLAFSMVGAKSPCDGVDPAIRSFAHDFVNDNCLYIRQENKDWEGAKNECESLGQYPHKWRLVELKNESVQAAFHRIMAATTGQPYAFWMGLVREEAKDPSDIFNQSAWANPSKWRWISDNSTLLSWSNAPLHWHDDDPNGWRLSWPELCIMVYGKQDPNEPSNYWLDAPCSGYQLWYNPFLVCESMDISTTTTSSTTTTTTSTAPTKPETISSCPCQCQTTPDPRESETDPWMSVAIVEMIIIIGAVVGYLAYRAYQHHKRQPFMLSADSDQSGTYENMPRFKGKRRPMRKDDESESESLDTSRGSKMKRLGPKKPKLSWMTDRKDEPKSPVPIQPDGKAAVSKKPEGKAESKSLKSAVMKKS